MGLFSRKKRSKYPSDGIERELFVVKTGDFKGDWWKGDQKDVFQFKSNHELTENDYSAMEEAVKKKTGAGWARVIKKS